MSRTKRGTLPGLRAWDLFAPGSFADPRKHGYGISSAARRYSISPVSSPSGRHRGYVLTCHPARSGGLHAWIEPTGSELSYPGDASLYRSPQKAAAAARKHAEHDRTGE